MKITSNVGAAPQLLVPSATKSTPQHVGSDAAQYQQNTTEKPPGNVPETPMEGWPTVAEMMASNPEFRNLCRFSDLNMKSLLYYQAELFQLRKQLHKHEYHDFRHHKDSLTGEFYSRADFLVDSQNKEKHEQWDLVVKIRKVLKEYSELPHCEPLF